MTYCDWCGTAVPWDGWPKPTRLPNDTVVYICGHCHESACVGDYSLRAYTGPSDPPVDDSTAD